MKGGKAIGSGTFGCIFSPAIVFPGTSDRVKERPEDYVCKVGERDSISREVRNANKLRTHILVSDPSRYALFPIGSVIKNIDPETFFRGANEPYASLQKTCADVKLTPQNLNTRALYYMPKLQGDLYKYTTNETMPVAQLRRGFSHYLRGLHGLHAGGYVHLDIKEENIGILTPTEFVLLDYDWVTALTPSGIRDFVDDFGTYEYYAHPPWFLPVWKEFATGDLETCIKRIVKRLEKLKGESERYTKTSAVKDFLRAPHGPLKMLVSRLRESRTPIQLLLQYVDIYGALRVLIGVLYHTDRTSPLLSVLQSKLFFFEMGPLDTLSMLRSLLE